MHEAQPMTVQKLLLRSERFLTDTYYYPLLDLLAEEVLAARQQGETALQEATAQLATTEKMTEMLNQVFIEVGTDPEGMSIKELLLQAVLKVDAMLTDIDRTSKEYTLALVQPQGAVGDRIMYQPELSDAVLTPNELMLLSAQMRSAKIVWVSRLNQLLQAAAELDEYEVEDISEEQIAEVKGLLAELALVFDH
jgi:hypothetical protein